LPLKRVQR